MMGDPSIRGAMNEKRAGFLDAIRTLRFYAQRDAADLLDEEVKVRDNAENGWGTVALLDALPSEIRESIDNGNVASIQTLVVAGLPNEKTK